MQDTLKGTALSLNFDVGPDSSSLLLSGFWGDFQPEASAKAHCWTGMAAAAAALTAPSPGPGGGEHCAPRRSARWDGEPALRDAHLLPGFSCSGRVAGSD